MNGAAAYRENTPRDLADAGVSVSRTVIGTLLAAGPVERRGTYASHVPALSCGFLLAFALNAATAPADEPPPTDCPKCDSAAECDPEEELPGGFETFEAMAATDVQHVDLDIELDFDAETVTGTSVLTIRVLEATLDEFTFRLRNNFTITEALINGDTPIDVEEVSVSTRRAILDRTYEQDEVFTLSITYTGSPVSQGFGSFRWTTHAGDPIASTLSEPYFAYTWWPCKDGDVGVAGDNSDKFTLDFTITVPDTMKVPSNGLLESETDLGDGRMQYHWHSDYPIATYLVSLGATNYNTWTKTYTYPGGTMPVEFFVYPEHDTEKGRATWEKVLDMLEAYRDPFGEYPFIDEKYGIYEFPFSGGMEHQTMTGQGSITLNGFEYITAHELAHQWWGDMTTCKTWHDIWLNEGFATYSEALWKALRPGGSMAAYHAHMANRRPNSFGGTVYRYNVSTPGQIFSTTNSYRKGAWVLHMLRHVMGADTFFDALAQYRATYENAAAVTDDFAAVCADVYGQDLSWFFDQWVFEPGAPSYEWAPRPIVVNGQHYLLIYIKQVQQTGWGVFTMPVDIRYVSAGQTFVRKVWNDDWEEHYVLHVPEGVPSEISFDPKKWILHPTPTQVDFVPGPPAVVTTNPMPGQQILEPGTVDTIDITFHTAVDTTVADYTLSGDNGGSVPFTFAYDPDTTTTTLTTDDPLPDDHYTLTVADTVTAIDSGMALDGELSDTMDAASLPSGDGQPGGVAVIEFDIVQPGDINHDGVIDDADRALFVDVLLRLNTDPVLMQRSDLNGDGTPDAGDIQPFLDVLP